MSNIYYKVLDKNMTSPYRDFKYELNNTYRTNNVIMCHNGFHACKNMYEMIIWSNEYVIEDNRFFKCTLGDKVIESISKVCSNNITIIEEIPSKVVKESVINNIDKLLALNNYNIIIKLIYNKLNLDIFIKNKDQLIRKVVARQGYRLDILVNDESALVRKVVARQGYGLDILVHDEDPYVRIEVADQGYGLDKLINDENPFVRRAVARHGYGLDILINDENKWVRMEVNRKQKELERDRDNE